MTFGASLILPAMMALATTQTGEQAGTPDEVERADPGTEAASTPIIVEGRADAEPIRAQTGSRIPGEPVYRNLNVATSTGMAGLTPGSGIEPFSGTNAVNKRVTSTCVSDNDAVGERALCLLLEAQDARAEDDIAGAIDIYRFIISSDQFAAEERLVSGTQLYNLAGETGDASLREEALIRLIDSDALPQDQRGPALRTLSDMAFARGDKTLALERLEQLADEAEAADTEPQIFANIAVLRRETGRPGALEAMQQALDMAPERYVAIPQGWLDFMQADEQSLSVSAEDNNEDGDAPFATTPVVLKTALGNITIALETQRAPITAANFLRYVDEGRFDGIVFYRAMHLDWGDQPNGLLQGGAQWDPARVLPSIVHEPTTTTGLSHTRGALSMAMGEPGTANGDFSIMLGDQTGLDANPSSEDPIWQNGYAVFGYVTDGMDVVEAIHAAPLDPEKGEGWMKGQMLADPVVVGDARRLDPPAE